MTVCKYDIVLLTQLGARIGVLEMKSSDGDATGEIKLLGRRTPFSGTVDSDGNCVLNGHLKTFMSDFAYTAYGKADVEKIALVLNTGKTKFRLTGKSRRTHSGKGD